MQSKMHVQTQYQTRSQHIMTHVDNDVDECDDHDCDVALVNVEIGCSLLS